MSTQKPENTLNGPRKISAPTLAGVLADTFELSHSEYSDTIRIFGLLLYKVKQDNSCCNRNIERLLFAVHGDFRDDVAFLKY